MSQQLLHHLQTRMNELIAQYEAEKVSFNKKCIDYEGRIQAYQDVIELESNGKPADPQVATSESQRPVRKPYRHSEHKVTIWGEVIGKMMKLRVDESMKVKRFPDHIDIKQFSNRLRSIISASQPKLYPMKFAVRSIYFDDYGQKQDMDHMLVRRDADVRDEIRDMLIPPLMPNTGTQCKERACPFLVHQDDKCLKHWRDSQTGAELLRELN